MYRIIIVNESSLHFVNSSKRASIEIKETSSRQTRNLITVDGADAEAVDGADAETVDEVDAETVDEAGAETVDEAGAEAVDETGSDLIAEIRSVILSIRQMRAYVLVRCKFHSHRLNEGVDELSVCEHLRFLAHKTVFSASEAQAGGSRCLV